MTLPTARPQVPDPSVPDPGDITQLLIAHREGDPDAFERLLPLVYG